MAAKKSKPTNVRVAKTIFIAQYPEMRSRELITLAATKGLRITVDDVKEVRSWVRQFRTGRD